MTRATPHRRKPSHHAPTLKTGVVAMAIGLGLLTASWLMDKSSPLEVAVSTALCMPAWWALGVGAVVVLVHGLLVGLRRERRRRQENATDSRGPVRLETSTLLALIDQAERSFSFADDQDNRPGADARTAPTMCPFTRPS